MNKKKKSTKKSDNFYSKALKNIHELGKKYKFSRKRKFSSGQKSAITREYNKIKSYKYSQFIKIPKKRKESKSRYKQRVKKIKNQYGQENNLAGLFIPITKEKIKFKIKDDRLISSPFTVQKTPTEKQHTELHVIPINKRKYLGTKKQRNKYIHDIVMENYDIKDIQPDHVIVSVMYGSGVTHGFEVSKEVVRKGIKNLQDYISDKIMKYKKKSSGELIKGFTFEYIYDV